MAEATVAGRKVHYQLHGPPEGEPLVLVMGAGGSCQGWLPLQVPEFARDRRVLIYDHRGVGGSDDPGGPFTTADLARDLVLLLDALGIRRAHVLGAFLGGMVAQELALADPERVDRLVLVGTWARPDAKRRLLLTQWQDMARSCGGEMLMRERLLWTLCDETFEQTDLVLPMIDFFRREGLPMSPDLFARQCQACLEHDTESRLGAIRAPTLLLCGGQDQLTPVSMHRALAAGIPDARLVTFPRCGHLVLVEAAPRLHEAVRHFLEEA